MTIKSNCYCFKDTIVVADNSDKDDGFDDKDANYADEDDYDADDDADDAADDDNEIIHNAEQG